MSTNETYAEQTAEQYNRQVEKIVANLHRLADDFGREATPTPQAINRLSHPYVSAAAAAVHHLHSGFGNTLIETMITQAAEVERAMMKERDTPTPNPAR